MWWRHQLNRAGYSGTIRSTNHSLTYTLTSPVWWRHQLNPAGYSGSFRSTLPHSLTHYQFKLTWVMTSLAQTGRIFWYHQVHPPTLTYSLPGQPHLCGDVTNSAHPEYSGTIRSPSLTHLLTIRSTSSVCSCHQLNCAGQPSVTLFSNTRSTPFINIFWWNDIMIDFHLLHVRTSM